MEEQLIKYYENITESLDGTKYFLNTIFIQRVLFRNVIMKYILDSGLYDISISKEDIEILKEYDLNVEIIDNVIKLSIIFPKEGNEDD
jgi:hypothetical protein